MCSISFKKEEIALRHYKPFKRFVHILHTLKQRSETGSGLYIVVVDDKDFDGVSSAYITYNRLRQIFPDARINVINNTDHGIPNNMLKKYYSADLIVIVDSSTNLANTYNHDLPIVIIDHHEIEINTQTIPENVCLINSKEIDYYSSVSAGALCYLVFKNIDLTKDDDCLLSLAVASCYSDIVPVDNLVKKLIQASYETEYTQDFISQVNINNLPITKNSLQYSIIPLINYSRRLQDNTTLKSITVGRFNSVILNQLKTNRKIAHNILEELYEKADMAINFEAYKHIIVCDITKIIQDSIYNVYPMGNFKGVFANRLMDKYKMPVIVGYWTEFEDGVKCFNMSVRSSNINSLYYFQKFDIDGGGHKPACGFKIPHDKLSDILQGYDEYIRKYNSIGIKNYDAIPIKDIDEVKDFDLLQMALENEFAYSDNKIQCFALNYLNQKIVKNKDSYGGFIYSKLPMKINSNITENDKVLIIPTMKAIRLKRFELNIIAQ